MKYVSLLVFCEERAKTIQSTENECNFVFIETTTVWKQSRNVATI